MAFLDQVDLAPAFARFGRLGGPQKTLVLVGVAGVILALYWFTMYGGKRTELQGLERRLTQVEAKLNESRAVASNLETFKREVAELEQKFQKAVQRLPNSSELPVLLTDITSLGKKSGLEFRSFRPNPEVHRGFYAEVPISIELDGSYHNLGVFFDRMSRLPRIVRMTEVGMDIGDETSDPPVLKVRGARSQGQRCSPDVPLCGPRRDRRELAWCGACSAQRWLRSRWL
jgi:type IV pilus assembly protein PilO